MRRLITFLFVLVAMPALAAPAPSGTSATLQPIRSLSMLVRLLITAPDSPILHYELGLTYYRQGVLPQAEKEFQKAMALATSSRKPAGISETELWKGYLRAVRAQRSLAPELKRILELNRRDSRDPEVARWLIDLYLEKGEIDSARTLLAAFPQLKQNADILSRWVTTGSGREDIGRIEERFQDLRTLLEVGSESMKAGAARQILDVALHLPPAMVTTEHKQAVDRAFERLRNSPAIVGTPEEAGVYKNYLTLLDQWRSRDKARTLIAEMQRRFISAKTDPRLMLLLARLLHEDGRHDEAMSTLNRALMTGLNDPSARLLYAQLLEAKGGGDMAVEQYISLMEGSLPAAEHAQASERIRQWLTEVLQRTRLPAGFDTLIPRISAQMPTSSPAQVLWGRSLESSNRFKDAYSRYEAAVRLDEFSRDAREGLARTAILLGRSSEAGLAIQSLDAAQVRRLWARWPTLQIGRRLMALGETDIIRPAVRSIVSDRSTARLDLLALAAEMALAEGRTQEAISLYALIRQKRPLTEMEEEAMASSRTRNIQSTAESYFSAGRYAEALDGYTRLTDSTSPQNVMRRAACMARLNRPTDAIDLLEREQTSPALQVQQAALLASLYEQTRNPLKAELVYRQLMQSDSTFLRSDAAKKLASLLSSRSRWSDALPLVDREGLSAGMTSGEKMAWVRERIQSGSFSDAARMGGILQDLARDTPDAYTLLGRLESSMGNRGTAQLSFEAALSANPQNEEAALGLADILQEGNETPRALQVIMRLYTKTKPVMRMLGKIHARRSEWEMAAGWMEKAAESEQDRMLTAWYWFRAGQIDEASGIAPKGGLFQDVLEVEAGRPEKLGKKNRRLMRAVIGETEDTAGRRETILGRWSGTMLQAARRRFDAGDLEASIRMCDDILARGDEPQAHYLKGVAQLHLGLYAAAEVSLQQAERSPDWSVPSNLKLGQLELIRGNPNLALKYLEHAGPGSDPAELILAWGMALALSKSPEQGIEIVRQIAKKSPRARFFLGRLMEENGKPKEAMELYKSAVRDDPSDVPSRFRMGLLSARSRDIGLAEMCFNAIVQNPDAPELYRRFATDELQNTRR